MRRIYPWLFILVATTFCLDGASQKPDWIINGSSFNAGITEKNGFVTLSNGLVSRTICLSPDGATTGFNNIMTGNELIRAIKPEAVVTINGKEFRIGGLTGQPVKNYLREEWIAGLKADSLSQFILSGYTIGEIAKRFEWKKRPEWMAQRKMYRTIAPWVTENPIFMHLRYSDNESVKNAVDQCVATGFEKIILSFGSGFDIEDTSKANLDRYKELTGYAHSKGISIGGYSLLASREVGGGADATIEPLQKHLPHYSQRLADLFGAGVQAAYRGSRLYDAPETLELVKKWVSFYKKHRAILDADIIHVKRADGRGIDAILHVNPLNHEKGLLMVYNPLDSTEKQNLTINVYYTGLSGTASVSENGGDSKKYAINRYNEITIPVTVEPNSQSWYIIK